MIQVDNLTLAWAQDPLFKNISFQLQKGERLGLIGRNGSGKSTLFRLIMGELIPDRGTVAIPKGYRIGCLDQHIRFTAPTIREEGILGLPLELRDQKHLAEKILFGLGFTQEDMDRHPSELSGGYYLRLHLAKVLISNPNCLLLDEPTNYLDILSIRWFERFLKRWPGEFILITHDRDFMDRVTTHTMALHRKELIKVEGNSVKLFEQILQAEQHYEKTRAQLEKKTEHLESFVKRFGAKASKATQANARKKMLERIPVLEELQKIYHLQFNFTEAPFRGHKMVNASHLDFSYDAAKSLIHDFSLEIEGRERIAFIGKNGEGKSTLLKLLAQELKPNKGEVVWAENVSLGYFGQTNIDRLRPQATIEDEIHAANPKLKIEEVKSLCGVMMFSADDAQKRIELLSGGEKSRVLLGKVLARPTNLLYLDEPTHHLDIESIEALIDAIEEFEGSVVIVTHSELILRRLNLDKIVICHKGDYRLFKGSYDDFLDKLGWPEERAEKTGNTRAQIQSEKNQVLKAIKNDIRRLETKIFELESLQERDLKALSDAIDRQKLSELSRVTGERAQQIEKLFEEYSHLDQLYREKEAQFALRLKEF